MKKILLVMLSTSMVVTGASQHISKPNEKTGKRPGKPDLVTELHNARKSLAHFIETTSDTKLAQTLTDFSKILKTAKNNPASITKEDVEHTFSAIEEITIKLDKSHDEAGLSGQCCCCDQLDCCKELKKLLCQIRGIIEKCCKHLTKEIKEIKKLIHRKFPCAHSIKIDHVPYVITEPGKYCVTKDLVFDSTGAAITVAVGNVTLNFANHSLTLGPSATGISATGISELTIENDIIQATVESGDINSVAIFLKDTNKVTIDNVFTLNTRFGIRAQNSNDVKVINSHFERHRADTVSPFSSAIREEACNNFVVEECVAVDCARIVFVGDPVDPLIRSHNCRVSNCQFLNIVSFIIETVDGIILENCSFTITDPTFFASLLQVGADIAGRAPNDVIVKDCTFTNLNAAAGFDGIIIPQGNGIVLENIIIDTNPAQSPGYNNAALHIGFALSIGDPTFIVRDLTLRNSIIRNSPFRSIYSESGNNNIVVDNCLITGAVDANIFFDDTESSTIKNSEINGSAGYGIRLNAVSVGSNNNALLSNVVSDNGNDGINVDTGSLANLVKDNSVFLNAGIGIHNVDFLDITNSFYFNDACNNVGGNCVGINPASLVAPPGFIPVSNGMNICCLSLNATVT
jgi:hypothetical protein